MIKYYYESKSDVLFKRTSLEHQKRTSLDKQINDNSNVITVNFNNKKD